MQDGGGQSRTAELRGLLVLAERGKGRGLVLRDWKGKEFARTKPAVKGMFGLVMRSGG